MAGDCLPKHALPRVHRAVIDAMAWSDSTEIHLAANLDAYTSQAVGSCVRVITPYGTALPASAYIVDLGPSGSGKTPMGKLFQCHFDDMVRRHDTAATRAWHEYDGKTAFWKAEQAGILKSVKKQAGSGLPPDEALQQRLVELENKKPQAPSSPPRRLDDFTLASLKEQAARHPAIFMHSDEGSAVLARLEKDLVGALCSAWSDMPISHARGNADIQLIRAIPSVMWAVQNSAFTEFLHTPKGKHFLDVGAASRCLYYRVDEEAFASERCDQPRGNGDAALQVFLDRAESFFQEQIAQQQVGWVGRRELTFSPGAVRELQSVDRSLQRLRSREGNAATLSYLDKMRENIIRLAARNHVIDGGVGVMTAEEVKGAEELVLWSYGNFIRLIESEPPGVRNIDSDAGNLWELLQDLRVREKIEIKTLRDAAFNVGLTRPTQFSDALGLLCIKNVTVVRDGHVYIS